MKRLAMVFVLCLAVMSALNGDLLASQCPSCVDAQSNACRRWGSGRASFQWASSESVSSGITLTAGSCGQGGESAVGYIMLDCDTHSSICNGDGNPCDDGLYPDEAFAIVKVTGSKKAFQQVLGGISFEGDKIYTHDGREYYLPTVVGQVGCEYKVPLESAGHARIKVTAGVGGCDSEFNGSRFNIQVKFFQQLSDGESNDHHTLLAATKGSISVKRNSQRNFDPVNFKPDLRDGSSLSNKKEIYRAYTEEGGQTEWKLDYRGETYEFGECEAQEGWCGEVSTEHDTLVPESQSFSRVKYPGWKESTNGLPPYAGNTGWNYDAGSNHLSYSMGDLGTMYYHCQTASDGSVRIRTVERCDEGEDAGEGQVQWTVVYDEQDRITYIHNASYSDPNIVFDPNDIDNATHAYVYTYETGGNDPNVTFQTRPDTLSGWTPDRQWNLEFDENGQATKFTGGCSSGCSGSGSFEHIEYDPTYTDQILWQKNADGDIILQNEYQVITYGEYEDAGWVYIPDSGFESQNVLAGNCETFEDQSYGWVSKNQTITAQICDPNSGSGQYLMLDDTNPDTLYQRLWSVRANTVYDLDVQIRGHSGESQSEAIITLYAVKNGYDPIELDVIDVNDFDLTDGQWREKTLQWDSTDYSDPQGQVCLINYADPWYLQLEVTGDKVDIDDFHMATSIWVGDQTKALIKKQERINPATGQLVTVLKRDYNESSTPRKMTERQYISSNVCRVTVYEYEDEAFTNITKKTEYEETGTDTSIPTTGSSYVTTYEGDDPNEIYIAYAPNGKRADYQRYENGNLVESYVIDRVTDANTLRETYTYEDVEGSENYFINLPDWRIKTHTNARGGVTEYEYMTNADGIHLLEKQSDPTTSAGRQVITYEYDDARRVIKEIRKLDNDRNLITEYNYNPATGYLDSMTVGNATTAYRYNTFGQVIRQFSPDGVMTGKSYGMGGELLSEFVIEENCDPNDADASLTLISQTRYTYTSDGQIEQIGKYKSDTSFSYQSNIDADSNNWIVTKYEYYSDGQKKQTIEDFGTGKANLTTEYFYNYQGELEKVLYPTGRWVKTDYDGRGLVISEETGYGADNVVLESAYGYDENGNLEWQSNPDGSYLIYTYDNYDRLKRIYQGSTYGPYTEKFYNNAGDVIREIACEADGTVLSDSRMDYDVLGNLKFERLCYEPNSIDNEADFTSHYEYDIAGNLRFDIKAKLASIEPNGITTEYCYNNQGRQSIVVDPNGFIHSKYYTSGGLVCKSIDPNDPYDPNAFITNYDFDGYGRLVTTTNPMGHYTENTYNSLNQITKQVLYDCKDINTPDDDIPVRQIRMVYDNLGNITRQAVMADPNQSGEVVLGTDLVTDYVFEPNGLLSEQKTYVGTSATVASTTFGYDPIGRRILTTDPEGNWERIYYDTDEIIGSQVVKTVQYENDPDGSYDYTITAFMLYDNNGRLSARLLDEDTTPGISSGDPNTSFTYDGMNRVTHTTAPDGIVTFRAYDGFGNVKQTIEDYGTGTENRTTEFVYNKLNQQYQAVAYDPNDTTSHIAIQTTTYDYTRNGLVTKITYPDDNFVEYEYNLLNKLDTETKRNGSKVYYWYDWAGNLVEESDDPDGRYSTSTPEYLTMFDYDGAGQLTYAYKAIENEEVSESSFAYNGFGATTSETAQYDGDISKTTTWTYDGSGNVLTQTHGETVLTYTHDGLGRIETITRGNDQIVAYDYIGRNTEAIDYPEAVTTQLFAYDKLGRIIECQSVDVNSLPILDFDYMYDSVGNRIQCAYSHLSTTVYDKYYYDTLNRLYQVDHAHTTPFSYLIHNDEWSMDELIMLASNWLKNETTNLIAHKNELSKRGYIEQIHASTEDETLLSLRLEQMESVLKEAGFRNIKSFLNSVKSIEQIAFDPDMPIYTLVEFGDEVPNNYRAETVRNDDGDIIAQIIWDNKDRMVLFAIYPDNGDTVVVTITYDSKGIETSKTFTVFDTDGNVTYTEDMLATEQQATLTASTMSVSSMTATSSVTMSSTPESMQAKTDEFGYDHLGNRTTVYLNSGSMAQETLEYSHNPVNQYSGYESSFLSGAVSSTYSFSHDDNGNLSVDELGNSYSYDYRNRLIEVQDANSVTIALYVFDAIGRRISKTVDSKTTYFFYDTAGRVIAEYENDTTPTLTKEYVWGNSINEILAMFTPYHAGDPDDWDDFVDFCAAWLCVDPNDACYDVTYDHDNDDIINFEDFAYFAGVWDIPSHKESDWYYLHDALGSVRGLVGGRFQRESDREFYNYDVYGNLSIQDKEESQSGNTILFAGMWYNAETGLYHTQYRAYDPETGRWLQFDPIGNADSMSLYEYVMSNPTNYVDPFGLKKLTYQEVKKLIHAARPAMARLIRDNEGNWKYVPYDKQDGLFSDELLICLFWLESKFDTSADAGIDKGYGYGLGQVTNIGAKEVNRYNKTGPYYPQTHHEKISKDITEYQAEGFRSWDVETLIKGNEYDQAALTIALLNVISRRDNDYNARSILKKYGPKDAPYSEYADVILACEKCLKESTLCDGNGIPIPDDTCNEGSKNCLEIADEQRQVARKSNPNRRS